MAGIERITNISRQREQQFVAELSTARSSLLNIIGVEGAGPWGRTELVDAIVDATDVSRAAAACVEDELIADAIIEVHEGQLSYSATTHALVYGSVQ